MALYDDKARIHAALRDIPGVRRVSPAWPEDWAQLPTLAITEASNRPADHRDDRAYVTELEYYIRVFAARASEIAEIAPKVEEAMAALGYQRTLAWESDEAEVRQKVLRYRMYI